MFNDKMLNAINQQINKEYFSSYLYLSMASYFEGVNLKGFANWMRVQSQEELSHALKLFDFVISRGKEVTLEAIEKPENKWESPLAAFKAAYDHEIFITNSIDDLVTLSLENRDHASNSMLQWFVNEQVEEVANADEIVQRMKLIGNDGSALYLLDRELATRVFVPLDASATAGA